MGSYDAILFDLDGTLVTDTGVLLPVNRDALRGLIERGIKVMVATGRSEGGVIEILAELGTRMPALVYNGAGLYCPVERRMLEERVLSNTVVARTLEYSRERGFLPVTMRVGAKFAAPPRNQVEQDAIANLEDLEIVADESALPREGLIRITLYSSDAQSADEIATELEQRVATPIYLTAFPLGHLPYHRDSPLQVVDVQPPCRGKGEALRYLQEAHSIPAERVVAVGDASNDVPMLEAAGLGVAMANAFSSAKAVADRVIGDNNEPSIALLVDELFGPA